MTVQVIAVTGGKGGVGKTNVAINCAVALAQRGKRVAILDADFGLANVDVLLSLPVRRNIEQVLDGECSIEEVMLSGPAGVRIIPASSGTRRLTRLNELEQAGLIRAFSTLASQLDVLIVDTAAGIADSVLTFANASQELLLVLCNEPSSLTDGYALIKLLNRDFGRQRFRVLANMVADDREGRQLLAKLASVCEQFLSVNLLYSGAIPFDVQLREAVKKQRSVLDYAPSAPASRAFRQLAEEIERWPVPRQAGGHMEFFVESLLMPVPASSGGAQ
ncbi:MinD/ParA family protein [Spongiibacter sp.]|uniref:MinD/ParA family ATP-binding protein n=1 Tax=Spongiibacter sp. TaxID=2024860 RepID=UPI0035622358